MSHMHFVQSELTSFAARHQPHPPRLKHVTLSRACPVRLGHELHHAPVVNVVILAAPRDLRPPTLKYYVKIFACPVHR